MRYRFAIILVVFASILTGATVMDRIAKGFTDDEIQALATWFAAQK